MSLPPPPTTPGPTAPAVSTAPSATGLQLRRIWLARGLAAAADALQIVFFPLFGEGFASPADWLLDGAMLLALTKLVGFHRSYLPSLTLELVPGMDLAPTWTAAALLATGGRGGSKRWRWLGLALAAGIALLLVAWLWKGPPFWRG